MRGPKCLVYHNITPAEFFEPYRPEYAPVLRQGREDLAQLAPLFPISCGDSTYNALELKERGFTSPTVVPIPVEARKWNFMPDATLMSELQDGRTNILFVGRVAPNKKQDDLITAFNQYLNFDPDTRLILIGKAEEGDRYAEHLLDLVRSLQMEDSVILPGSISDAELEAYYRTAHLFWSMSEHEGFCVPLIEAMWFDVPVLAFKSSAVPETMGHGGILFSDKDDPHQLAALARVMITDRELRAKIIRAQREQRHTFLPERVRGPLFEIVARLQAGGR
jgi:glycosyltransferase involved in cell wall biosynthesis